MTRRCMAITTCGLSTFSSKPAPLLFIVSLSPKRTATERGRERIRIHHPQQPGDGVGLGSPCSRRTNWRRNDSLRTAKSAMSTQVCPPHRLGAMRRARASRDDAQGLTGVLAEGGGHEADPDQNLKSVPCQAVARNRHADARHRPDQVVVLFRKGINCFSRSLDPPLVQDSRLPTLQETQPLILHRQSEVLVSEAERPRRAQV